MSEEYDLRKSEASVGQLLPIIKAANGKIVDGLHRQQIDRKWKTETWTQIKTDEDYWKARAHLNFSRRNAQEARAEKIAIVNNLAEYYNKRGCEVEGQKPDIDRSASPPNEVLTAVIKALDGAIPESWIRQNIDTKYVQKQERRYDFESPETPFLGLKEKAIDYLEADKKTVDYRYGSGFVDRIKKEIKEETKKELLKSPAFQHEVIKEVTKPSAEISRTIMKKMPLEAQKRIRESLKATEEQAKKLLEIPEVKERGKWYANWLAHGALTQALSGAFCPICQSGMEQAGWLCHNLKLTDAYERVTNEYQRRVR